MENESNTGLSGLAGDPHYPDLTPTMPPVILGNLGRTLDKGFHKVCWHWWPAYSALNTIPYNGRPSECYERPTNLGDLSGSKGSSNNVYLNSSDTDYRLKKQCLYDNCRVLSLQVDPQTKKISQVNCVDINSKDISPLSLSYLLFLRVYIYTTFTVEFLIP